MLIIDFIMQPCWTDCLLKEKHSSFSSCISPCYAFSCSKRAPSILQLSAVSMLVFQTTLLLRHWVSYNLQKHGNGGIWRRRGNKRKDIFIFLSLWKETCRRTCMGRRLAKEESPPMVAEKTRLRSHEEECRLERPRLSLTEQRTGKETENLWRELVETAAEPGTDERLKSREAKWGKT